MHTIWQRRCGQLLASKFVRTRQLVLLKEKCLLHASSSGFLLNESVISGNVQAVLSQLNDTNTDVNAADIKGWTPLMNASRHGHFGIVEALIQHNNIDLAQQSKAGLTAIELSMFYRHREIYDLLERAGSKWSISHQHDNSTRFSRDAAYRSSKDLFTKTVALDSSVFIVLRRNYPLVESAEGVSAIKLLRLDYATVQPFLTVDNVIFLGVDRPLNQKMRRSSSSSEKTATVSHHDPESLSESENVGKDMNENFNETAHFCVDLSNRSEEEILNLVRDCSPDAELLHPYRIRKLELADMKLFCQAWPLIDWHQRYSRCATCGSATKKVEAGYKRVCENQQCRTHKGVHNTCYPRMDPTVICAVASPSSDRCILASKVGFPDGMYSCVAGFVEPGETIEEACLREVQEELGIDMDLSTLRYHSSQSWPGPSVLMIGYVGRVLDDTQEIQIDSTELKLARWFDRSEVVEMLVQEHRDELFIPPKEAIAHRLVKSWILETAFK